MDHTKAWQRQHQLKKKYSFDDVPSLEEINNIISMIKIGKTNEKQQTERAKALFAIYYLTACRASEIVKTLKLRKRKIKYETIFGDDGTKKIIYNVDKNKNPIIESWIEEHDFLGTSKSDIKFKEYSGYKCLEIRTENRKNKNRTSKLLPIPIEKESEIAKHILTYINKLKNEDVLFDFSTRRAAQLITQSTGFNLHFIRHIRATHLITLYDFNEQMLVKFMGWTDSRPAKSYLELRSSDLMREFYKRNGDNNGIK